jgi:3-hydroxyacyl-CoA dehydrogenase
VHTPAGAYSATDGRFHDRSPLPVYRRQAFPDSVLGERWPQGTTIMETPALRMWHLGDDVAIVSFKSKANTIATMCWTRSSRRSSAPSANARRS